MAKPQTPNQKKAYNALNTRLNRYVARVQGIYDKLNQQAATIAQATGYQGGVPFHFSDYPEVVKMVNDLMGDFVGGLQSLIYAGTSDEWKQSNIMQDLLAKKVMRYYDAQIDGEKQRVYYQSNSDALKAFQQRTERGMNLSTKLWDQSGNYKQELEYAISAAIEKGTSAVTLSKQLSQYLNDFPSLKADYTDLFGHAVECYDCEYRSIRLARSEINMAYRTAEQTRWRQFDFILGYEIKLSGSHPAEDICDSLAGRYPKDFVWTGWHPNDMCYSVPIVMSEEQYWDMREGNGNGQDGMVTDLPDCMKKYVSEHGEQIRQAQERGTLPYWLRDNAQMLSVPKEKSFVMTDAIIDDLQRSAGFSNNPFNKFTSSEYNRSAMRGFDLQRFDRDFEAICDMHHIRLLEKSCKVFENGNAALSYSGKNEAGKEVNLVRNFVKGKNGIEVNHSLFDLPDELQGIGISKSVFRSLFKEYDAMGISRIELRANKDVGGYCWAKYGFCANDLDAINLVKKAMATGKITALEYKEAMTVIDGFGEIFPMSQLANLKFGRKLLMGETWYGFLDYSDLDLVRYMKDYVGYLV